MLGRPPLDRVIDVPGLPGLTDLVKGNMAWVFRGFENSEYNPSNPCIILLRCIHMMTGGCGLLADS
jgi:hypothetical protein